MRISLNIKRSAFNAAYFPKLKDYGKRFEIYYGGAGSGKSHFIACKVLIKALERKRTVLVIRKTLNSQKRSCWKLITDLLTKWSLAKYCKINLTDLQIVLPNGSIFYFAGINNPELIKSIVGITDIWTEEATELAEEDFDQLNLRLRAKAPDLQIFVSFNPISKANWVYRRWFEREPGEDCSVLKTTYKDNRFLPPAYVKALEDMVKTNPTYFKIYALGEFCTLDRLVYSNWKTEAFDHAAIDGELLCGLDFGFVNDPTAFVASILTTDKIYIFKAWTAKGKTNKEIADAISSMGFGKSVIIADSAEPKSVEELRRSGITRIRESVKGPDSIIHGIQKLQQYELIVHPDCAEIITELENYTWKKDRASGEYINDPIDEFNHCLDALRYSLQSTKKKLRTIDKAALGL